MKLSKLFPLLTLLGAFILYSGCDIANSDEADQKQVAVTMQVQNTLTAKYKAVSIDSLTEVKFLVEELELESATEDSADFEVENLVVNLPLDGSQIELTSQQIPAGFYDEFEMEIENDDDSQVNDPDFYDGDLKYSIVIKGFYNKEEFLFRSEEDFEIELELNPALEITDGNNSASVAIDIDPSIWFVDSQGNPLDPSDPVNRETIEENIKSSFEAEGENDKDDEEEDNDDDDD